MEIGALPGAAAAYVVIVVVLSSQPPKELFFDEPKRAQKASEFADMLLTSEALTIS